MKRGDWEMMRYVEICGENGIGKRKKIFFYFFVGIMRERTPQGQGPAPSEMGKRLRRVRSAHYDKSRPYIYVIRFAYTHILAKLCFISIIDKALLQD
jgi:hypothetical protein